MVNTLLALTVDITVLGFNPLRLMVMDTNCTTDAPVGPKELKTSF